MGPAPKGATLLERTLAALGLAAAAAAALKYATLLLWLGLMHINTVAGAIAVACLPHPAATFFLAVLCVAALLPVDRPFAPWQQRLARHISDTAHAYFPISMHCEDAAAFEAKGDKFVIGALRSRRPLRLLLPGGLTACAQGLSRTACCRSPPSRSTTAAPCCRLRWRPGRGLASPAPWSSACRW